MNYYFLDNKNNEFVVRPFSSLSRKHGEPEVNLRVTACIIIIIIIIITIIILIIINYYVGVRKMSGLNISF